MTLSNWATPQTPSRLALLEHDLYSKFRTFSFTTSPWFHWCCCCWSGQRSCECFFPECHEAVQQDGVLVTAAHGLLDMDNCVSLLLRQCVPGRDPRMPGRKDGVRPGLKKLPSKQTRTSLASIILTIVCSLWNKLYEVQANMWEGLQRG